MSDGLNVQIEEELLYFSKVLEATNARKFTSNDSANLRIALAVYERVSSFVEAAEMEERVDQIIEDLQGIKSGLSEIRGKISN